MKLQMFLQDLEKTLNEIPEENIVEPPLSIVGPALEELFKYFLEEEHVVEAYKNLIADSMNIEKQKTIHPAYFGIIKQMTKMDALTYNMLINNHRNEVFTGFISVKKLQKGITKYPKYRIAFWDTPPQNESATKSKWDKANNYWNLELAEDNVVSLHALKIHGLVDTQRTDYDEEMLYNLANAGYLNSRFQNILSTYKDDYSYDFHLYRKRIILYYLTDFGKTLGHIVSQ